MTGLELRNRHDGREKHEATTTTNNNHNNIQQHQCPITNPTASNKVTNERTTSHSRRLFIGDGTPSKRTPKHNRFVTTLTTPFLIGILLILLLILVLYVYRSPTTLPPIPSIVPSLTSLILFIILPLLTLLYESLNPNLPIIHRCVAASFLSAVVANVVPTVVTKALVVLLLTVCGLYTRDDTTTEMAMTMTNTLLSKQPKQNGNNVVGEEEENENGESDGVLLPSSTMETGSSSMKPTTTPTTQSNTTNTTITTTTTTITTTNTTLRALLSVLFLVTALLIENFFIWVVSSTYTESHTPPYPPSLRDNGRLFLEYYLSTILSLSYSSVQSIRDILNIQWATVVSGGTTLLLSDLGLATTDDGKKKSIFTVGTQGAMTLALVRLIRTVSFSLTVVPSQRPDCFPGRFGYGSESNSRTRRGLVVPVMGSREWFQEGFVPRGQGGCNDLIVSGHATVVSLLGCLTTSVMMGSRSSSCGSRGKAARGKRKWGYWGWGDGQWGRTAIWMLLGIDFGIEVFQGFHYSVDMFLGMVLTRMVFGLLSDLAIDEDGEDEDDDDERKEEIEGEVVEEEGVGEPPNRVSPSSLKRRTRTGRKPNRNNNNNNSVPVRLLLSQVTKKDLIKYCVPSALAFWVATSSTWNVNYFVVVYAVGCGVFFAKGQTNYAKHLALTMLFFALINYL